MNRRELLMGVASCALTAIPQPVSDPVAILKTETKRRLFHSEYLGDWCYVDGNMDAIIKPGTKYFDFYDAVMKVRLLAQELVATDIDPIGRMPHEASELLMVAWM